MVEDWEEQQRVNRKEIADAYCRLIELVTKRYSDLESANPRIVGLAKGMALADVSEDRLNDLHFHLPVNMLPVHTLDGKHYPNVSYSVTAYVPLWSLYLQKAREVIEILDAFEKRKPHESR